MTMLSSRAILTGWVDKDFKNIKKEKCPAPREEHGLKAALHKKTWKYW